MGPQKTSHLLVRNSSARDFVAWYSGHPDAQEVDLQGVKAVAAIGVTNQRETVVIWDRATGEPIHPAIVWQDRRTAPMCERLRLAGHEARVTEITGLLLDPYFAGTKIAWLAETTVTLLA